MAKSIIIPSGILSLSNVDFKCPNCEYNYYEKDYYKQLYNSRNGLIYKYCKGCKKKIGITTDIRGDVQCWLKENEIKLNNT